MSIAVQAPAQAPSSSPSRDLIVGEPGSPVASGADPRFAQYKVIRRNGAVVGFEPSKITIAMTKAFLAVNGGQSAASARVRGSTRGSRNTSIRHSTARTPTSPAAASSTACQSKATR